MSFGKVIYLPMRILNRTLAASALMAASAVFAQVYQNSAAITPDRLRTHLEFIASDLLQGRDTPSVGLDTACHYVASHLKLMGAKPAGDNGTFFQNVPLTGGAYAAEGSSLTTGGKTMNYGEGFFANGGSGEASGEIVYVGYGWKIPKLNVDPYAGLDLKGKVLLVQATPPPNFGFRERRGELAEGAMSVERMAQASGAAGIIYIGTGAVRGRWDASVQGSTRMGRVSMANGPMPTTPTITVNETALSALVGNRANMEALLAPTLENAKSATLAGSQVNFKVVRQGAIPTTQNVVAIIEGSDPVLKNEYVAFGAHIDHVGVSNRGDGIFNGAHDDGSGTVSILEIAHAISTMKVKPKRSMLFVWHTGEEKGLWGSQYFVNNPTVPLNKIVAQLNIDMIGKSKAPGDTNPRNATLTGPNAVYLIGANRLSTELGKLANEVNNKHFKMVFDPTYDAPNDPNNFFGRSDHYNYAQKGIPVLFWFDGVHEDYHGPDDEVDRLDFNKMAKTAQSIYAIGLELGNRKDRPKVDLRLDQFANQP